MLIRRGRHKKRGEAPVRRFACVLGFLVLLAQAQAQAPAPLAKGNAPAASQTSPPASNDKPVAPASPKVGAAASTLANAPAPPEPAQNFVAKAAETLDKAGVALNDIEAGLERPNLSDADLAGARQRIGPIADFDRRRDRARHAPAG